MGNEKNFNDYLIQIKKTIPKNRLINVILIILKFFPLLIITHDWNIHFSKSLSRILSIPMLLSCFHSNSDQHNVTYLIVAVIFLTTLVAFIIHIVLFRQMKQYDKIINEKLFVFNVYYTYWINFFFVQYFFMFIFNNYFCGGGVQMEALEGYEKVKSYDDNCRDVTNIIVLTIQSILLLYNFFVSILMTLIISEPFSYSQSLFVSEINRINTKIVIMPLLQGVLVAEYFLPFEVCVSIKIIVRVFFCLYFIGYFYREPKMFFSNIFIRNGEMIVMCMCFISCIVEFCFLFDWNNDLHYLQEGIGTILFKIVLEISLSLIIIQILSYYEKRNIIACISGASCSELPYELLNKLFYILFNVNIVVGDDLLYKGIEKFYQYFMEHKEKGGCEKSNPKCYCLKYSVDDLINQSDDFLAAVKELRDNFVIKKHKLLKTKFPLLYKHIENFILMNINKQKINNRTYSSFLLSLVMFYIIFDKNYSKSLFYLGEFMKTKYYKSSKILKVQAHLIKLQLLQDYQHYLIIQPDKEAILKVDAVSSENNFSEMHKRYTQLTKSINIEEQIMTSINEYVEAIHYFHDTDSTFDQMVDKLSSFQKKLKQTRNYLLFSQTSSNVIKDYHLCAKLTLFYKFFYHDIPPNIQGCFHNILDYDCKCDPYSTLLINFFTSRDSWKFTIDYISDELCARLGYSLNEIREHEIGELFPNNLKKCYEYEILKKIQMGQVQILLREYVIVDKSNYAHLFNMLGIVIFTGEGMKLFVKVFAHNNARKKRKKEKNKDKARLKTNECFAIVNKVGKVIAISSDFEKYFSLSLPVIKKYKINLFHDVLKIESTNGKHKIKKNLNQIYDNISELNFNLMQNSSNEEFANTYKNIKKIQQRIAARGKSIFVVCDIDEREMYKKEKVAKLFYTLSFAIELDNKPMTFLRCLGKEYNDYPIMSSKNIFENMMSTKRREKKIPSTSAYSNNNLAINGPGASNQANKQFMLNRSMNETMVKLRQVQIITLKYLQLNFRLKPSDILTMSKVEINEYDSFNKMYEKDGGNIPNSASTVSSATSTNSINTNSSNKIFGIQRYIHLLKGSNSTNQNSPPSSSEPEYKGMFTEKISEKIRRSLYKLVVVWIFFSLVFLVSQSIILILDKNNNSKYGMLNSLLIDSILMRNFVYSIVSSITRMQSVTNGLQKDIIDSDFENSVEYHQEKLSNRTDDFLKYYKIFEKEMISLLNYGITDIFTLFREETDYISIVKENLTATNSMYTVLNFAHLQINPIKLGYGKPVPFSFNQSYFEIEDREVKTTANVVVYVFENYLTRLKYTWDEMDGMFLHHINENTNYMSTLIYSINICNGCLLFVLFLIQAFIYKKINNQIFAKYYFIYNYLQFFSSLLLKKGLIIKKHLENTDTENMTRLNTNRIGYQASNEDILVFKDCINRISAKTPILIKPFKTKLMVSGGGADNGSVKDTFISVFGEPSNRDDTRNSSAQTREEFKTVIMKTPQSSQKLNLITNNSKYSPFSPASQGMSKLLVKKSSTQEKIETNEGSLNQHGKSKRDLQQPYVFLINLITFAFICLTVEAFCVIDSVLRNHKISVEYGYSDIMKHLLELTNTAQEIMLLYTIVLFKNEPIVYEYQSRGYLFFYDEKEETQEDTPSLDSHDVLKESLLKYASISNEVKNALQEKKNQYPMLSEYFNELSKAKSCETVFNFVFRYKDSFRAYTTSAYRLSDNEDYYVDMCNRIGGGVNSEGIKIAVDSFVNTIKQFYSDFNSDPTKTSDMMLQRFNDEIFNMYQLEVDLMLDKTIANYLIAWQLDFTKFDAKLTKNSNIFFSGIIVLVVLIDIFYIWKFTVNFMKYNNIINEVEPCIYNTIMF